MRGGADDIRRHPVDVGSPLPLQPRVVHHPRRPHVHPALGQRRANLRRGGALDVETDDAALRLPDVAHGHAGDGAKSATKSIGDAHNSCPDAIHADVEAILRGDAEANLRGEAHLVLFESSRSVRGDVRRGGVPPRAVQIEHGGLGGGGVEERGSRVQEPDASGSAEVFPTGAHQKVAPDRLDVHGHLADALARVQEVGHAVSSRHLADGGGGVHQTAGGWHVRDADESRGSRGLVREGSLERVDVELTGGIAGDGLDDGAETLRSLKIGDVVGGVLRSRGEDAVSGGEAEAPEGHLPRRGGALRDGDLVGGAVQKAAEGVVRALKVSRAELGGLVSPGDGLEVEVIELGVEDASGGERGTRVVEVRHPAGGVGVHAGDAGGLLAESRDGGVVEAGAFGVVGLARAGQDRRARPEDGEFRIERAIRFSNLARVAVTVDPTGRPGGEGRAARDVRDRSRRGEHPLRVPRCLSAPPRSGRAESQQRERKRATPNRQILL